MKTEKRFTLTRSIRIVLTASAAVALAAATLVVTVATPSSAATLNAIATPVDPVSSAFLASGGSSTEFDMSLPPSAACSGDTANDFYHVWTYLVQKGATIGDTTFDDLNGPSQGLGLYDDAGTYIGPVNTAVTTGQVTGLPEFEWGPRVTQDDLLSTLLYTGGTTGVWEGGIACANKSGVLTDNWNTQFTFNASESDPGGFTWTAIPGPAGSSFANITSNDSAGFTENHASTFSVTATGSPKPTITETGALPAGVTLSSAGVLAGTPTATGTFPITLKATNGIGNPATQAFTLTVGGPPAFTSADKAAFAEGVDSTFTPTASGSPTPTITESGTLPAGVSFNGTALTGTATATGAFPITFTAANGITPNATQSFTLTVGIPPTFTSAASASFTKGTAGTFTPAATGTPAPTITESGALPTGVTYSGGALHGTPTVSGTFDITFTAANGIPTNATQDFTLSVGGAPTFTSASSAALAQGVDSTFTPTATGTPAPTITEAGALPTGVSYNGTALTGTATETGTFDITFTAANGFTPNAVQDFTLTVGIPPTFTSDPSASFTKGTAGSFTPTATGTPAPTITESGALPAGVTFTAGSLTGTPTVTGSFPINLTAANGIPSNAVQAFVLTVNGPPTITSANSATFTEGSNGAFTPTATGFPTPTITEAGALPTGVSFIGGKLTGTPTVTGSFPVTFTAANGITPDAVQDFTLNVASVPQITSAASATFTKGTAGTFTPAATGTPAPTITESGALPAGVTFSAGSLSGTPTEGGVFAVTFTASNGAVPSAVQHFTLTVDAPPVLTSASSANFTTGQANSFRVTASGTPTPSLTESGALPAGVTFVSATGVLSGNPSAIGTFPVTLTATNGIGSPAVQSFTLTAVSPPPVSAPTALNGAVAGMAAAPGGTGYWLTDSAGDVAPFGSARTYGSLAGKTLNSPIVGIAVTATGNGYWLVGADGGIFAFGDAAFHGSLGGIVLNQPIVGIAATATGGGYWLVAADGGVFAFGNAGFHGSMGGVVVNKPVVGIAATADGGGYWLVAADGGVFSFGNAVFHGSLGGTVLNKPVVSIAAGPNGGGYWLVGADGGVFAFGTAGYRGSLGGVSLNQPIVGSAADTATGGYWLVGGDGGVFAFDAPFHGAS